MIAGAAGPFAVRVPVAGQCAARRREVGRPSWKFAAPPIGLCLLALSLACSDKSTPAAPTAPSATNVTLPNLEDMLADKVLGDGAASITIIEYSSPACPHCASFHTTTLPQIKTAYIDTGKAKLIYRDFPIGTAATSAAMVARCSGNKFFDLIDLLYRTQSTWASSSDTTSALKGVVAQAGLSSALVDSCLADTDLRSGIVSIRSTGESKYGVNATPTFIFNERQTLVGAYPFSTFDEILKGLL
jgi:protein-disulfide isomerase